VVLARGYTPYGEPLWTQGTGHSEYGFTGEDVDSYIKLLFLRARYMSPRLGIFLARDPWGGSALRPDTFNGFIFVGGNPVLRTDPLGFDYGPRTIEDAISPFLVIQGSPASWLQEAVRVDPVDNVYRWFTSRVDAGIWRGSTLSAMYTDVRMWALITIFNTPNCLNDYERLLEANHIALIVAAEAPGNHAPKPQMDRWELYPRFLAQEGRDQEPGWDKSGHFLVNALLAFESKYTLKYPGTEGGYQEPYIYQVGDTADFLTYVIGSRNLQAIEDDYRRNPDPGGGYVDASGLDFTDATIFNLLATLGNAYELLTSPGGSAGMGMVARELWRLRTVGRGSEIDAFTDYWLQHPKDDNIIEGLADPGVYRDFRANRLGVHFGLKVFSNPLALPPED
jgi:RHS repeat-associated protein